MRILILWILALGSTTTQVEAQTRQVDSKVLILARRFSALLYVDYGLWVWQFITIAPAKTDIDFAGSVSLGLQAYGIPFETQIVPTNGEARLPALTSSSTQGNYGNIVM